MEGCRDSPPRPSRLPSPSIPPSPSSSLLAEKPQFVAPAWRVQQGFWTSLSPFRTRRQGTAPENGADRTGKGKEGCAVHPRTRGAAWVLSHPWHPSEQGCPARGVLLCSGPPSIPQPTLACAVLHCAVRGRAGSVLLRNGQLSRLAGEKKIISLPYFSLHSVPARSASAGI